MRLECEKGAVGLTQMLMYPVKLIVLDNYRTVWILKDRQRQLSKAYPSNCELSIDDFKGLQ